jgi:thymidylate synthase ThyX
MPETPNPDPQPRRDVYLLSPKQLSPETIAVTFAKTSRSPQSFREIAAELSDEKSAEFNEKWVVGYGHSSVAEHAVLHLAVENVSRLAIENLESNRLASYTEKSTRYQKWDANSFFTPPELKGHSLLPVYVDACRALFDTYRLSLEQVRKVARQHFPGRENENDAAWDRVNRSRYVDVCRFLLPAASLANVGITANARVIESAVRKMLSDPLAEVREIGAEVKQVTRAEAPTLVKYADRVEYLVETRRALAAQAARIPDRAPTAPPATPWCNLVDCDAAGEEKVLAAALYRCGQADYPAALAYVTGLDEGARLALAADLLGRMNPHDVPLRELEYASYTFDVVMDQGAYFEVKRHRMMTQTPQRLTADLGYAVPLWMVEAGMEAQYAAAMQKAAAAYRQLAAWNPDAAAYVIPNGFRRRVLLGLNLREAYHFCSLRAAENAHFSVRRVALKMAADIFQRHPALAAYMQLPKNETWQNIEKTHFARA